MDLRAVHASAGFEVSAIEVVFKEFWGADLKSVVSAIESLASVWRGSAATIMFGKELVQHFFDMSQQTCDGFVPIVGHLEDPFGVSKMLRSPTLVPAEQLNDIKSSIGFGARTVVYHYFISLTAKEWLCFTSVAECIPAVADFRRSWKQKARSQHTMEIIFDAWESGAKLTEMESLKASRALRAQSLGPPDVGVFATGTIEAAQASRTVEAAQVRPAGRSPADTHPNVATGSSSLMQRAAAHRAKRRRVSSDV